MTASSSSATSLSPFAKNPLLSRYFPKCFSPLESSSQKPQTQTAPVRLTPVGSLVNGIVSSMGALLFTQPLFAIKTSVINTGRLPPIGKLYKGLLPNLCTGGTAEGVAFFSVHLFIGHSSGQQGENALQNLAASVFAGCIGSPINAILERSMIQQQVHPGNLPLRKSLSPAIAAEGLARGLFKAVPMNCLRDSFYQAGIFAFTGFTENLLTPYIPQELPRSVAAALLSGVFVGVATTPFDEAETHLQSDYSGKHTRSFTTLTTVLRSYTPRTFLTKAAIRGLLIGSLILNTTLIMRVVPQYLPKGLTADPLGKTGE